jgi:hypothetical protein
MQLWSTRGRNALTAQRVNTLTIQDQPLAKHVHLEHTVNQEAQFAMHALRDQLSKIAFDAWLIMVIIP